MQAAEIIKSIDSIYARFHIMPNLAMHMKRVAAVAAYIADHWEGPSLDNNTLIAAALVHDLGNIAKADFDGPHQERIMGEEFGRVVHWKAVQAELTAKYGAEEYEMTRNILRELHVPQEIITIIEAAGFRNNVETANCGDWHCKILAHADHLVAPHGIVSLHERLEEGRKRYGFNDMHSPLVEAAYTIEKQIAQHLTVSVDMITEHAVKPYMS